jgi:hypothetical protein
MIASSELPRAAGVAAGIADTERVGINTKAQAANPINESRFIIVIPPDEPRVIATGRKVLGTLKVR